MLLFFKIYQYFVWFATFVLGIITYIDTHNTKSVGIMVLIAPMILVPIYLLYLVLFLIKYFKYNNEVVNTEDNLTKIASDNTPTLITLIVLVGFILFIYFKYFS